VARRKTAAEQQLFEFKSRGGPRKGAGRRRQEDRKRVSHASRAELAKRFPVHVTTRVVGGLPSLRRKRERRVIERAFGAGAERFGFRLVHYSIQSNHLHLIAEAEDRTALTRGMQGLLIRVAKALNRLWQRRGGIFADRYHDRILRTPREVRNALAYVLRNHVRHGIHLLGLDPCSSARWFDGWGLADGLDSQEPSPLAVAHTWLARLGWRRGGRLSLP
jgi:REP element-mobilizing transposase RayT